MDESQLFDREIECEDGTVLVIKQCLKGDVGCVVWDAALVLSKYLETESFRRRLCPDSSGKKKLMLELGAGTGATGLVACKLGWDVVLTDLPDFVGLMELNIRINQGVLKGSVSAKVLRWGEDVTEFLPFSGLVLMSDCVYYPEAVAPLVRTLVDLTQGGGEVLCCYEERTIGQNAEAHTLFDTLMQQHFDVEEIQRSELDPVYNSEEIHVKWYKRNASKEGEEPS